MIYKILSYLAIIAIGYLLKSLKFLDETEGRAFSKIVIYITLPAVIIQAVTSVKLTPALFSLTAFGILTTLTLMIAGFLIFRRSNIARGTKGSLILTFNGLNLGLFAYPFAQLLWGGKGLAYMSIFDMGNGLMIYTVGYAIAILFSADAFSTKEIVKKVSTFPPLLAIFAAIILNLSLSSMPDILSEFLGIFSGANAFLALLTIGVFLNFERLKVEFKNMAKAISLKYLIGAALGMTFYFVLRIFEPSNVLMADVVLLSALMPAPLLTLLYSIDKKLDPELAGGTVTTTVVVSSIFLLIFGGII
ncbi:MAG: AEC family transporter [Athalassotoga sp.]